MSKENDLLKVRNLVSSIYDIQKLRIAVGNRLVTSFNVQLGQEPGKPQEEMGEEEKKVIQQLRKEYRRITDAYVEQKITLKKLMNNQAKDMGLQYIQNENDYKLVESYDSLLGTEEQMVKLLEKQLQVIPIYTEFLQGVKGCGPLMSGVIISYLDPYKARHVSSFWKYVGLDVVGVENEETGEVEQKGRNRSLTEMREYTTKSGETGTKKSLTYNPFVKTKLVGVLGTSFLRMHSPYAEAYYDYKNRLDNHAKYGDRQAVVKHRMATRYMIKQFLRDLWVAWRKLENLPVTEPYEVAFLGRKPHKWNYDHTQKADIQNYGA